mgnify:CR=1 FL=1|tara:strand:- start:1139 stop:2104 length:966 start_codon:yes stop_codon:yes gene_type:complete
MIKIKNLSKTFDLSTGIFNAKNKIYAVSDVSLNINQGNSLGLVGESGCGKSTLARCVAHLIKPSYGQVFIDNTDITKINNKNLQKMRSKFQMVFQDPGESLNPRMKISSIIGEPLNLHTNLSKDEKKLRIQEVMEAVGLKKEHLNRYPHEFSGGQKQRIGIGRAIATKPKFIILDEPTSSLDVSIRGQILKLLKELQNKFNLTYLLITHDLSVVYNACDEIAVMYLGKIVEYGPTKSIFNTPFHPYTRALLSSVPIPDPNIKTKRIKLNGEIPSPLERPSGCVFRSRCPNPTHDCKTGNIKMKLIEKKPHHWVDQCCVNCG